MLLVKCNYQHAAETSGSAIDHFQHLLTGMATWLSPSAWVLSLVGVSCSVVSFLQYSETLFVQ